MLQLEWFWWFLGLYGWRNTEPGFDPGFCGLQGLQQRGLKPNYNSQGNRGGLSLQARLRNILETGLRPQARWHFPCPSRTPNGSEQINERNEDPCLSESREERQLPRPTPGSPPRTGLGARWKALNRQLLAPLSCDPTESWPTAVLFLYARAGRREPGPHWRVDPSVPHL